MTTQSDLKKLAEQMAVTQNLGWAQVIAII